MTVKKHFPLVFFLTVTSLAECCHPLCYTPLFVCEVVIFHFVSSQGNQPAEEVVIENIYLPAFSVVGDLKHQC